MIVDSVKYPFVSPKSDTRMQRNNISFRSCGVMSDTFEKTERLLPRQEISNQRIKLLTPIKTEEEYYKGLDDLYKRTYLACDSIRNLFDDTGYIYVDKKLKALPLYCGMNDKSNMINSWLSGREKGLYESLSDEEIADSIRTFEYSLRELDKKYGKYTGRIFRTGYFNPNIDRQYYSASDRYPCAYAFCHHRDTVSFKPDSIIKVKNAHKIYKFQEDTRTPVSLGFFDKEHEILVDRKSRFKKLDPSEFSAQDISDIKMILGKRYHIPFWKMNFDKLDKSMRLYYAITVWEEI